MVCWSGETRPGGRQASRGPCCPPCRRLRAAAAASPATDRILVTTPHPRVRSRGPTAVGCWARDSRTAGRWHGMAGCCSCCRGASPKMERHRPASQGGVASETPVKEQAKFCARVMSCLSRRLFQLAIEPRASSARQGHECVRLHRNRRGLARAMVGSLSPPNRANRCLKRKTPVATHLILAAEPRSDG